MSQTDTSTRSESDAETTHAVAGSGRKYVSRAAQYLRRGINSGAVIAIIGGAGLLSGLRALREGDSERSLGRIVFGATFLAAAFAMRQPSDESDVDEADVVASEPDVEAVANEAGGVGEENHATGEAAAAVVDTSPDIEDAKSEGASESDTDAESTSVEQREVADTGVDSADLAETTAEETEGTGDATETGPEEVERLGEAAFDKQSQKVPAPQRAFNQGFLAQSAEAFWGVREHDDAVLVSQDFDAVQGGDGVRYVASSEIGDDVRELPIPSTVLTHWDEVFGGGTAVTGGDDILFVTTDDLAADHLLRVLPAEWADDVFDEE